MGMYVIGCPLCGKPFYWFSGNLDQRCPNCKTTVAQKEDGSIRVETPPLERVAEQRLDKLGVAGSKPARGTTIDGGEKHE